MKKLVILGHTGFIGRYLYPYIKKQNIYSELHGFSLPQVNLAIEKSIVSIEKYFDNNTDLIFLAGIKPNIKNSLESFVENIEITANVAKLIKKKNIARVLYFSSAAVYGEDIENLSISEDTNINLRSYYGIGKYTSENLLDRAMQEVSNTNLIVVRPATVYGPSEGAGAYNPSGMLSNALSNKPILLWGDGEEKREFLYVDDVVKISTNLIQNTYCGILNISSGVSYTFADVVKILNKILHRNIQVISQPRTKSKVDNIYNNSKLMSVLPRIRFTSLEEGLKKIFYEYK